MAAAEQLDDKPLLYAPLEFENKATHVYLTSTKVLVESNARPRSHDELDARPSSAPPSQIIDLREVIAVRAEYGVPSKDIRFRFQPKSKSYLLQEERPSVTNTFSIFVIKRISRHRWRHKKCMFVCRDYGTCQIWIEKIQEILRNPEWKRPKRLLVFVNPFGGKRKAPKIFTDKVRPLLELAGIYTEVIVTKRAQHARDVVEEYDLQTIDGLVCVGGDGTFSEVMNGLLDRANAEAGISQTFRHQPARPDLRIGIIPAGSTDAVVYSVVGINDPVTSTLQIILGDSIGIDVTALYKKEEFIKYTLTMTSYGYYGDLLKDSESLRWMGPKRYTYCGFKTFLSNRSYEGEVSFLLASEEDSHPRDGNICYTGCYKCRRAFEKSQMPVRESHIEVDIGMGAGEIPQGIMNRRSGHMTKDGWHHVKGRFTAINVVTLSCRCDLSEFGMSTYSHLGDGCMDLILVQDCSRLQFLRHLARIPMEKADQFDFDYVQVYRVKEFQFQPLKEPEDADEGEGEPRTGCGGSKPDHHRLKTDRSNSVWNCDGEVFEHPKIYIQAHCQLIKLFGRGIEEEEKDEGISCPSCCCSYDSDK